MRIAAILILLTPLFQPPALSVDASAQGHTLTIVVRADAPSTLRITLPPGWSGAPAEQAVDSGVQVRYYHLDPGDAVGLGVIIVRVGAVEAHAYVWGRDNVAPRAEGLRRVWLPVWRH